MNNSRTFTLNPSLDREYGSGQIGNEEIDGKEVPVEMDSAVNVRMGSHMYENR